MTLAISCGTVLKLKKAVVLLLLITAGFYQQTTLPRVSSLPAPTALTFKQSTREAGTELQTLIYSADVTSAGSLSRAVLVLPVGSTSTSLKVYPESATISGNRVMWISTPIRSVAVGSKISIAVGGINLGPAGNSTVSLTAYDTSDRLLANASTTAQLVNSPNSACRSTDRGYIARENMLSGVPRSTWDFAQTAYDANKLSAYADKDSYVCGDTAYFKIDTTVSNYSLINVYRMGYYNGSGARLIWRSTGHLLSEDQAPVRIYNQASPYISGMVDATHWNRTVAVTIDGRFTPGTYMALISSGANKTYVPFTVRPNDTVKHDYVLLQATTTWQAYNNYGGKSFYRDYIGDGNYSSRLSFNRPYHDANYPEERGAGQFLRLESGMVYLLEKYGYDVFYWTDADFQNHGAAVGDKASLVILPAHDEYYSYSMRSHLTNMLNQNKASLASFGANQIHRHISFIANTNNRYFNVNGRTEGYDYSKTTFRSVGAAYAEQNIIGAQYGCSSMGNAVTNNSWLWNGVTPGTYIGGFYNGETDYVNDIDLIYNRAMTVPANNQILVSGTLNICRLPQMPKKVDIVARTNPSGSRVFGGSTFGYACFVNKTCTKKWMEGENIGTVSQPRYGQLEISDQDSQVVSRAIENALHWTLNGQPKY